MRKKKYSKPSDMITDYQEKQLNNLNKSIEETADTSKSFLGPMVLLILLIVAVFSTYYAVSRVGQKSLQVKLQEISEYIENNTPSWRNLRLLGYQQKATQITTGYTFNIYFSTVDTDTIPEDEYSDWLAENEGKLYGRIVFGIENGEYIDSFPTDSDNDMFNNRFTTTLRVDGRTINCVRFYGLIVYSDDDLYNPYSQYGEVYVPHSVISHPEDFLHTGVPVYSLTGELVSPTQTDENSIATIFSGFKLLSNIALTGVEFIEFCLGLIWVIFT